MEIYRLTPGQIVFEGQNLTRAIALGAVKKFITEQRHVSELDADDLTIDMPGRVTRAWWRDGAGFVQENHDGAVPVTVVNIPNDSRVFGEVEQPHPKAARFRRLTPVTIS